MNVTATELAAGVARVNGVALTDSGVVISTAALRQRACTELLRQAAQSEGLLDAADRPADGDVISAAAAAAIEALLERKVAVPDPEEDACRRHYAAHEAHYRTGERVRMRHILFAVTPGVDVGALRKKAEGVLLDVRCCAGADDGGFGKAAASYSNCPSGADGGDLGWLTANDCAPEFAREVFGGIEVGVLSRLVHSRFGFHVVEVLERDPGTQQAYEDVRAAVSLSLRRQAYVTALRQYLRLLAGAALVEGIDLDGAESPLVQ